MLDIGDFVDKRVTVIESIQKLLALGVSDKEIADNLSDVGIGSREAMAMIREARDILGGVKSKPLQGAQVSPQGVQRPSIKSVPATGDSSSLSMDEEIVRQIPIKEAVSSEEMGLKIKETNFKSAQKKQVVPVVAEKQDKLEEMSEELDEEGLIGSDDEVSAAGVPVEENASQKSESSVLGVENIVQQGGVVSKEAPVKKAVSQEKSVKRSSSFVEQKSVSRIEPDEDFEELWKKGIVVAVNAKLGEMRQLKDDIDLEINQKVEEALRKELYQFKVLIDSQKELLVSSNKDALNQKQKEIVFIIDAKIAELRQYNKNLGDTLAALEASKKQQASMLAQISAALEDAKKTKAQLVVEMNAELIKSKSSAQAFLDSASNHLAQMDERINKALELEKNIAEGMLAQAEQRIEQLTISRADDLISQLQVELNKIQSASSKFSPEVVDSKVALLENFKGEFVSSMQDGLNQINAAIESLNEKSAVVDRVLQEKTLAIDAKLEELTKFEKDLTQRLSSIK